MKRKQMQLADSRLVLSSGAKLAHCHGQPVGRLILRPRCKLWITCAMLDALIERAYSVSDGAARLLAVGRSLLYPSFQPFDERHRFLSSWLSERTFRHPYR